MAAKLRLKDRHRSPRLSTPLSRLAIDAAAGLLISQLSDEIPAWQPTSACGAPLWMKMVAGRVWAVCAMHKTDARHSIFIAVTELAKPLES
jgi:hypothetical protein